jgi:hypothetical protein
MFCPTMNSEGFQKCITFTLPSVSMSNTTSHHISRRLPKDLHTLHLSPRSSSPINNQWTEVLNLPNPILSLLPLPITLIYQTPPAYQYKHHFQTLPHYTKHIATKMPNNNSTRFNDANNKRENFDLNYARGQPVQGGTTIRGPLCKTCFEPLIAANLGTNYSALKCPECGLPGGGLRGV